ncbi:MAG: winged helix-turn-helix transcriptional regulator [Spirochaetaceae bacterium]|nr:winged helix-turn-helix transcriptional regulator [Spirochaetaceae bacterium]
MKTQDSLEFDNLDNGLRNYFQLYKTLFSDFHPEISPPGLNRTHWRALMHIAESGPECMKGVGGHVGLEAGSFTPVADKLIKEGLVERIPDPSDRRRVLLRITGIGNTAVKKIKRMMKNHYAHKLSVLDNQQLSHLAEAMNTISDTNRILQGYSNE